MKTLEQIFKGIGIASIISTAIVLFMMLAAGSGCTPQKRLDRLVKKHPELSRIDTVKVTDTFQVIVPGIRADTNFTKPSFLSSLKDTIILQKEQLTVKIYEYRDYIFVEGTCDTVYKTVIREVRVPYPTVTTTTKKSIEWHQLPLLIGLTLLAGFFYAKSKLKD